MAEYEDEPYVVIERRTGSTSSFLLGLAVGAAVALLFAPESGDEIRRGLRRRARRIRRAAKERAGELTDTVVDRYQHARRTVEEKLEAARTAIEIRKEQASRAIEAGREAAYQARAELERRIAETKAAYQAGADVGRRRRAMGTVAAERDRDGGMDEPTGT
jgi:gas vesicle protein